MTTIEFNQKFESLNSKLFAFAMRLTRNTENAKDLMQETAYRAFNNRDKFKMGTNFKAWLTTIMRNTFINNYRKTKKRSHVNEPLDTFLFAIESSSNVANAAKTNIMLQELNGMFDEIGEAYSKPFLMFYRGYHYDEISDEMKIPMGTVKSRIFFARKKLKALIEERYI